MHSSSITGCELWFRDDRKARGTHMIAVIAVIAVELQDGMMP